jgi:hypothetical protein
VRSRVGEHSLRINSLEASVIKMGTNIENMGKTHNENASSIKDILAILKEGK